MVGRRRDRNGYALMPPVESESRSILLPITARRQCKRTIGTVRTLASQASSAVPRKSTPMEGNCASVDGSSRDAASHDTSRSRKSSDNGAEGVDRILRLVSRRVPGFLSRADLRAHQCRHVSWHEQVRGAKVHALACMHGTGVEHAASALRRALVIPHVSPFPMPALLPAPPLPVHH